VGAQASRTAVTLALEPDQAPERCAGGDAPDVCAPYGTPCGSGICADPTCSPPGGACSVVPDCCSSSACPESLQLALCVAQSCGGGACF
jgi:hypothetical protein